MYDLDKSLDFKVQPYDQIIIRKNPNSYSQKFVTIEGEVAYPGNYALSSKNERISDLIKIMAINLLSMPSKSFPLS